MLVKAEINSKARTTKRKTLINLFTAHQVARPHFSHHLTQLFLRNINSLLSLLIVFSIAHCYRAESTSKGNREALP